MHSNSKFKWPNDAHIAVVFNMSWESWNDTLGTAENLERGSEQVPAKAHYTRGMRWIYEHAYAEMGGMQRLLDIWKRHDITASCYADGLTVSLYPDLARKVRDGGHEYIVQGWDHGFLWHMSVKEQEESIDKTIDSFNKVLGVKATGFSSSGGHLTPETPQICADRGFKYICGMRNCDVPFIIDLGKKKLVGMTSYDQSDFGTAAGRTTTPEQMLGMWRDAFDVMYDEGMRGHPQMLAYGTHPFVARAHRTKPLEDTIRYVKSKPGVWLTTRGEIADWMLKKYPDMDLSSFYPEAPSSDAHYGLSIGLGGEEARAKAMKYRRA